MTPDFRLINADSGKDLTESLRPYVMSLSVTESVDDSTDTLSLSLNGEGVNQFPASGTNLQVHLGYRETSLANMGVYKIDTKILSGMPLVLAIKAGASDFNASYKIQKSRHWDNKTLADILQAVASDNGLHLVTDMAEEAIPYLEQVNESDMAMIARLAKEYSAYGTIKAGKLVFKQAKSSKKVVLSNKDLLNFRLQWTDKPVYDSVVTHWHDRNSNISHREIWNGQSWQTQPQDKAYTLKTICTNQWQARKYAKAKFIKLKEMTVQVNLTLPGRTDIVSKTELKLEGINSILERSSLIIKKVSHTFNQSGYKIAVVC